MCPCEGWIPIKQILQLPIGDSFHYNIGRSSGQTGGATNETRVRDRLQQCRAELMSKSRTVITSRDRSLITPCFPVFFICKLYM